MGNLIKVRGVVTRRSGVFPQLSLVKWDCGRCGTTMGPFVVADNADDVKPKQCVACQAKGGFTVRPQHTTAVGGTPVSALCCHVVLQQLQLLFVLPWASWGCEFDYLCCSYCAGACPTDQLLRYCQDLPARSTHTHAVSSCAPLVSCCCCCCLQVNASQTIYKNYQKLTLQETPGSVPAGRLPRHKEVILLYDLIDCARPGEEVEVTGEGGEQHFQMMPPAQRQPRPAHAGGALCGGCCTMSAGRMLGTFIARFIVRKAALTGCLGAACSSKRLLHQGPWKVCMMLQSVAPCKNLFVPMC